MKKNLLRILFFITLICTGFTGPLWLFAAGTVIYIFMYLGIEVIILAVAIDAYFGFGSDGWFMYTICTSVVLFLLQWAKPHLSVYNQ